MIDHPSDSGREVGGSSRQGGSHVGRGRTLAFGAGREARASSSPATTRSRDVAYAFLPGSVPGTPSAATSSAVVGAARLQRLLEAKDEEVQRFRREAEERQQLWASARQGMADEWEVERSLLLAELESLRSNDKERRASKDKDRDRDEKDDKADAAKARMLLKEEGQKRAAAESKRRGAEQLVVTLKRELKEVLDEAAAEKEKLARLRLTCEQQGKQLRAMREGLARAHAEEARRAAAAESSVYAAEAGALERRDAMDVRVRAVRRLADEVRSIDERLREVTTAEEVRLREEVRGLRERVRGATAGSVTAAGDAGSDPLWAAAGSRLEATYLQSQSAATRRELERRALVSARAGAATEEERAAGERAVHALKEATMAECAAVTAKFRTRADAARAQLAATREAELQPMLEAETAKARKDRDRVQQLREQASALEEELSRVEADVASATRRADAFDIAHPGGGRGCATLYDGLAGPLRDVADAATSNEATVLAFSVIDDVLPFVDDVVSAIWLFEAEVERSVARK